MTPPLVSVICLCYNHAKYIEEAILSVLDQTYSHVELIVVDDASADASAEVINRLMQSHARIKFIQLEENVGNCKAFNIGFAASSGAYVIDFAADDVLLPNRIEVGVRAFEKLDAAYGVQFSDAILIDKNGHTFGLHSDKHPHKKIPEGEIYRHVISQYFICAPSMLIKREVLEELGGYDEKLAYEDFDFWVRSSRRFKYVYVPQPLVKRRVLDNSLKSNQFQRGSKQLASTYEICKKIKALNENEKENAALVNRLRYELKVCLRLFDISLALKYFKLMRSMKNQ